MNHLRHPVKRLWVSDMSPVCKRGISSLLILSPSNGDWDARQKWEHLVKDPKYSKNDLTCMVFASNNLSWIAYGSSFWNCGNKKSKKIANARSRLYHLTWILTPIHVAFWKSPHRADDRLPTTAWRYTLFSDTYHTQADYHMYIYIYIHVYYVYPMG